MDMISQKLKQIQNQTEQESLKTKSQSHFKFLSLKI